MDRKDPTEKNRKETKDTPVKIDDDGRLHLPQVQSKLLMVSLKDIEHLRTATENRKPQDEKSISSLEQFFSESTIASDFCKKIVATLEQAGKLRSENKVTDDFADEKTCQAFREAHPTTSLFTMSSELIEEKTLAEVKTLVPNDPKLREFTAGKIREMLMLCCRTIHDGSGTLQPWISEYCKAIGGLTLFIRLFETHDEHLETVVREYLVTALVNRIAKEIKAFSKNSNTANFATTLAALMQHQWEVNRRFSQGFRQARVHLGELRGVDTQVIYPIDQQRRFLLTNPCLDAGKFMPLVDMILRIHAPTNKSFKSLSDFMPGPDEFNVNAVEWLKNLLKKEQALDSDLRVPGGNYQDVMEKNIEHFIKEKSSAMIEYLMLVMELNHLYYLKSQFSSDTIEYTTVAIAYIEKMSHAFNYLEKRIPAINPLLSPRLIALQSLSELLDRFDEPLRDFQSEMLEFEMKAEDNDDQDKLVEEKPVKGLEKLYQGLRRDISRPKYNSAWFACCYYSVPILRLVHAINKLPDASRTQYLPALETMIEVFTAVRERRLSGPFCVDVSNSAKILLEVVQKDNESKTQTIGIEIKAQDKESKQSTSKPSVSFANQLARVLKFKLSLQPGILRSHLAPDPVKLQDAFKPVFDAIDKSLNQPEKATDLIADCMQLMEMLSPLAADKPLVPDVVLPDFQIDLAKFSKKNPDGFLDTYFLILTLLPFSKEDNKHDCMPGLSKMYQKLLTYKDHADKFNDYLKTLADAAYQANLFKNDALKNSALKYFDSRVNVGFASRINELKANLNFLEKDISFFTRLNELDHEIEALNDETLQAAARGYFNTKAGRVNDILNGGAIDDLTLEEIGNSLDTKLNLFRNLNQIQEKVTLGVSPTGLYKSFYQGACQEITALLTEPNTDREKNVMQVLHSINTGTQLDKATKALEALKTSRSCSQLFISAAMGLIGLTLMLAGIALLIQTGTASQIISGELIQFGGKLAMTGVGAVLALGSYASFPFPGSDFVKYGHSLFKKLEFKEEKSAASVPESKTDATVVVSKSK